MWRIKGKWILFITCLPTSLTIHPGLGWFIGFRKMDIYGAMENPLMSLFLSSGSVTDRVLHVKTNVLKSWEMVGTLPNVARKTNTSSVKERKVSCSQEST